MERITRKDENGVVVGVKPLKQLTPDDVQELLNKLYAVENYIEYWEKKQQGAK